MDTYRYVGTHPALIGKTALGYFEPGGLFQVQVTQIPTIVDGVDWTRGWHETNRKDWAKDD